MHAHTNECGCYFTLPTEFQDGRLDYKLETKPNILIDLHCQFKLNSQLDLTEEWASKCRVVGMNVMWAVQCVCKLISSVTRYIYFQIYIYIYIYIFI